VEDEEEVSGERRFALARPVFVEAEEAEEVSRVETVERETTVEAATEKEVEAERPEEKQRTKEKKEVRMRYNARVAGDDVGRRIKEAVEFHLSDYGCEGATVRVLRLDSGKYAVDVRLADGGVHNSKSYGAEQNIQMYCQNAAFHAPGVKSSQEVFCMVNGRVFTSTPPKNGQEPTSYAVDLDVS
jgi:hypothetical protein